MDVIGHNGPRQYAIILAIETQQIFLHERGDARIAQMAGPVTPVQIFLDLFAFLPFVFEVKESLPLAPPLRRHGIRQPVSDELLHAGCVEVGQIPPRMPASKAQPSSSGVTW
jgi:hypothetical protein